jgi:hypothetical protein
MMWVGVVPVGCDDNHRHGGGDDRHYVVIAAGRRAAIITALAVAKLREMEKGAPRPGAVAARSMRLRSVD